MLLYWSLDQYNNVQKCVERKEGAMLPDGRKGLILRHFKPDLASSELELFGQNYFS